MKYDANQLPLLSQTNLRKEFPIVPEFYEYLFSISRFFYSSLYKKAEQKPDLESFIETFVKNCPNFNHITDSINYGFQKKEKINFVIIRYKGEHLQLLKEKKTELFNFFFNNKDFVPMFKENFPENIIENIFFIKATEYKQIEEFAKQYCLSSIDITKRKRCFFLISLLKKFMILSSMKMSLKYKL